MPDSVDNDARCWGYKEAGSGSLGFWTPVVWM